MLSLSLISGKFWNVNGTRQLLCLEKRGQNFVLCIRRSLASCRKHPGQVGEGITFQVFPGRWLLSADGKSLAKGAGVSHWQLISTQLGRGTPAQERRF